LYFLLFNAYAFIIRQVKAIIIDSELITINAIHIPIDSVSPIRQKTLFISDKILGSKIIAFTATDIIVNMRDGVPPFADVITEPIPTISSAIAAPKASKPINPKMKNIGTAAIINGVTTIIRHTIAAIANKTASKKSIAPDTIFNTPDAIVILDLSVLLFLIVSSITIMSSWFLPYYYFDLYVSKDIARSD